MRQKRVRSQAGFGNFIRISLRIIRPTLIPGAVRGAGDKLEAIFPDCQHDFPPEARQTAYRWLDRWQR
jgi:hypothetical protein